MTYSDIESNSSSGMEPFSLFAMEPFAGGRDLRIPLVMADMKGDEVILSPAVDPGLDRLVLLVEGEESLLEATLYILVAPKLNGSGSPKAAPFSELYLEEKLEGVNAMVGLFKADETLGLRRAEKDSGSGTPIEPSGTW